MIYRTRTYIAADYDNQDDVAAVEQLKKWNDAIIGACLLPMHMICNLQGTLAYSVQ